MKDIPGYEGLYAVTKDGQVWSHISSKYLNPRITTKGYLSVRLYKNKVGTQYLVHRLVSQSYLPSASLYLQVNHKDGNKQHNYIGNLEWVSLKENIRHAHRIGLYPKRYGESRTYAKLTNATVKAIRQDRQDRVPLKRLAAIYGVHKSTISRVANSVRWSHLPLADS